jgi:signal transduction histidine kinase
MRSCRFGLSDKWISKVGAGYTLSLLVWTVVSAQQPIHVTNTFTNKDIFEELRIYTDTTRQESIETISAKKLFFRPISKKYPTGIYPHWCYFTIQNESSKTRQLILKYEQIFSDTLFIYTIEGNKVQLIDSPQSWKLPNPSRPYPYIRYPVFKIMLPGGASRTIWIQLLKRDGDVLKLPFSLWDETTFYTYYNNENLFRGFFYGWLFLVSLFALILFIFLHERIYIYYSLYVLFLILILAATGGTINQLGWFLPAFVAGPAGNSFFNMAYIVFNLRFTTLYIGANYLPRWLVLFTRSCEVLCILLFVCLIVIENLYYWPYVFITFSYLAIGYALLVFALLFYGLRRRSIGARFYSGAIVPLFISSICYWLASLGVIHFGEWIISCFKGAVLAEIFILSIGLAYQYYVERQGKRRLQIELINTQAQVIQTQETERQRLAADLHDDLGGTLATLRRKLGDLRQRLRDPQAADALGQLEPLVQKSTHDLRRIAHNLMPPEFDRLGLRHALDQLVQSQPVQPTRFSFVVAGEERRFPLEVELNLYRIVSELVQNIHKHAEARRASVQLLYYEDHLSVLVEDDGLGSRVTKNSGAGTGLGLKNSNLRAEYIGARLRRDVTTAGTLVVLEVPYASTSYGAFSSSAHTPD